MTYLIVICSYELIITGILRDKTMDDKLIYIPNDDKQKKKEPLLKIKTID